jgi:membrane-bound lytic murein transglycosylase MltF
MKKFTTYVKYFKKYAADYHFNYLMLIAQGYQESRLDQSKRSSRGAIGTMQVMPKYASAPPINVPDVSRSKHPCGRANFGQHRYELFQRSGNR